MRHESKPSGVKMMTAPIISQPLADEVARQKHRAIRHLGCLRWVRGISLLAGVAIGVGTWFSQPPADRDGLRHGFALGLAGATFLAGGLLGRLLFPRPNGLCPQCKCDWNLESENDARKWSAWRCCPGCGLSICDEIGDREKT